MCKSFANVYPDEGGLGHMPRYGERHSSIIDLQTTFSGRIMLCSSSAVFLYGY